MLRFRHAAPLVLLTVALSVGAHPAMRKDPTGVYGVIDRVVFEPDAENPERVQLRGVFAVADPIELKDGKIERIAIGEYAPPRRGYLYYEMNPLDPETTRREWAGLAALAGTGVPVAFGGYFPPQIERDARPHASEEPGPTLTSPDDTAGLGFLMRYNGTVRRAGEPPKQPDRYPLPMRPRSSVRANSSHPVIHQLQRVPEPLSPADGATAPSGAVRLIARNVDDATLSYVFEIEDARGVKETSAPITRGDGQTAWSPSMKLEPGAAYTWRVRAVAGDPELKYPVAQAAFRAR